MACMLSFTFTLKSTFRERIVFSGMEKPVLVIFVLYSILLTTFVPFVFTSGVRYYCRQEW